MAGSVHTDASPAPTQCSGWNCASMLITAAQSPRVRVTTSVTEVKTVLSPSPKKARDTLRRCM